MIFWACKHAVLRVHLYVDINAHKILIICVIKCIDVDCFVFTENINLVTQGLDQIEGTTLSFECRNYRA